MKGFLILVLFLVMSVIFIAAINHEKLDDEVEESVHDVIDVSVYVHDGGFLTMPTEGYVIRYLDGDEVITLKKTSDSITVKYTCNESFLIRKSIPHITGEYYRYELYWNGD